MIKATKVHNSLPTGVRDCVIALGPYPNVGMMIGAMNAAWAGSGKFESRFDDRGRKFAMFRDGALSTFVCFLEEVR